LSTRRRMRLRDEEEWRLTLAQMSDFDRMIYEFGVISQVVSGVTLRRRYPASQTSIDQVLNTLANQGAFNWETGLSTKEISKITKLSESTTLAALNTLIRRRRIAREKRGIHVKYYIPFKSEATR